MINTAQELDEHLIPQTPIKIYSKKAIWGFSFAFTSLFGGVLFMQNLRAIGKKKEANFVLIGSLLYTMVCIIIVNIPKNTNSGLTFFCNGVGGWFLSEVLYKKYFKEQKYEEKKIWKALIISLLIMLPFLLAIIYSLSLKN